MYRKEKKSLNKSIETIDSPEFINLQPLEINPLMSKCDIKVLYIGQNRNGTYIDKDAAIKMSKTLRGAPIVGYFKESKNDFADHGEKITIDDEGIKFQHLTKPYGFVSPDAEVWFQKFDDYDEQNNTVTHQYLMTTGYLWTGQYEECAAAVEQGRPQSMELESQSLQGHWATIDNNKPEFFIINDAVFMKLCILGEDVEPCFEGASVSGANLTYALDKDFKVTLYSMMQDLKNVILKGEQQKMVQNKLDETVETPQVDFQQGTEATDGNAAAAVDVTQDATPEAQDAVPASQSAVPATPEIETNFDTTLMENVAFNYQTEYKLLKEQYDVLQEKYNEISAFVEKLDNERKEKLISDFSLLSDEQKQEVRENMAKYSYEEIDAKLSKIYAHKSLNAVAASAPTTTIVTLVDDEQNSLPEWLKAVRVTEKTMN